MFKGNIKGDTGYGKVSISLIMIIIKPNTIPDAFNMI